MKFTLSEGDSSSFLKKFKDNGLILNFLCSEVLVKKTTKSDPDDVSQHRESVRLEPEDQGPPCRLHGAPRSFRAYEADGGSYKWLLPIMVVPGCSCNGGGAPGRHKGCIRGRSE